MKPFQRSRSVWIACAVLGLAGAVAPAHAVEVRQLRLQSPEAFLQGTLEGLSVDALGTLRLAPRAERLTPLEEPFVLSAAVHPDGWVVGTGNDGKVLLVKRDGTVEELFSTAEPEVFAVWADPKGVVYAGSSPDGKVYRWDGKTATVFFEPHETYIWQLAPQGNDLLVATGTQGKLYRVDAKGHGSVFWDSDDAHVRSVAVRPDGTVLAGTAGSGLIVRLDAHGKPTTLYDAAQPEVVAITTGPDGSSWAAAVASEASQLPAPKPAETPKKAGDAGDASGGAADSGATVEVAASSGEQLVGSRPPGFKGARSEILRIDPSGRVESVARLDDDTVYSLLWSADRLWIGTGLEGKIYGLEDKQLVLENDVDEKQVMALLPGEGGAGKEWPAFATTNAAAFYRLTEGKERQGTYTSPVLDAGQIAHFGTFRWRGEQPAGTEVAFAFRSGLSAEPDASWSAWTRPQSGREIALDGVPEARFFQWQMTARASGETSPTLTSAELSYRQQNLAPRITAFAPLDPGQVLVPFNFNPSNQVYEPAHPNREGIFTSLEPAPEGPADARLKPLWRQGYRTLRWDAEDPNGDTLTYRLWFRTEAGKQWLPVADELDDTYYSFDASALPDGVYRFKLLASDRAGVADAGALTDERVSEPVVVDHTPPRLVEVTRQGDTLRAVVEDALDPLRDAQVSIDGGEWQPAPAADGLLDGSRETLAVPVPAKAALVMLRLTDAAFNTVSFDLLKSLH